MALLHAAPEHGRRGGQAQARRAQQVPTYLPTHYTARISRNLPTYLPTYLPRTALHSSDAAAMQAAADVHPFYRLRDFKLRHQEPLPFPDAVHVSTNYFNPQVPTCHSFYY